MERKKWSKLACQQHSPFPPTTAGQRAAAAPPPPRGGLPLPLLQAKRACPHRQNSSSSRSLRFLGPRFDGCIKAEANSQPGGTHQAIRRQVAISALVGGAAFACLLPSVSMSPLPGAAARKVARLWQRGRLMRGRRHGDIRCCPYSS
ncbi:hypothetical protein GUJ93_ZPchr0009g1796 [Zizania palustris]|uniref:Uncharacterized protein n=1 Tax=Zizania palustris TaxID=103762 RepID=A0A8J5VMQ0_ZIZPA|nr:hypothetical protein GUJ93_ZPchr0009g1796 [Zizania palustris]